MEVITTHIKADFDAVGSMVAAKKLYPDALLVFSEGEERSLHDFFITSSLYSLDLESLSNIDLDKVTKLIVVDTRQKDRIGKFGRIVDKPEVEVHLYDHHPEGENDIKGDVEVFERTGACVTIMTKLLKEKKIKINSTEATIMALGIYEDTGSLTFNSTTPDDFYTAAYLVKMGANLSTVSNIMESTLTKDQIFVLADLIRNMRGYNFQGHKITVTEASINEYQQDLAIAVNRMREMENLETVIALIRAGHKIHLIARSVSEAIDVSIVARHFKGGGHKFAAAATIKDMTLIEAREELQGCLYSVLRSPRTAGKIMSFPVKTIAMDLTVDKARRTMIRYNVNVLPVVQGKEVLGYISRAVVSRAMHHGLQESPVGEVMSADIVTASPNAPFAQLYNMVVGKKQRVIPVMEKGQLVGVVTRTDILNNLLDEQTQGLMGKDNKNRATRPAHFRNLLQLLRHGLPEDLFRLCKEVGQAAKMMGMTSYLVGGFVRDLILDIPTVDLDIVVEGDAILLAEKIAEIRGGKIAPHAEFKTATVTLEDDVKLDFATARLEYYEQPAALPVVEASSIKLDLMRRDFTINSLIINLDPGHFGEMSDFFGAWQDLKDKQIRVLHNLSFVEDPTRVLRAVKFEQRFGFSLGKHTMKLLTSAVKTGFLDKVNGRRIITEIKAILEEEQPLPVLARLDDLRILERLVPQLKLDRKKETLLEETEDVLAWYEFLYLDEEIEFWKVWLFGLVGTLKTKYIKALFERLAMSSKVTSELLDEKLAADNLFNRLHKEKISKNSHLYRLCRPMPTEGLLYIMAKSQKDEVRKAVSGYLTKLKFVHTEIAGKDLQTMGFEPGPVFARILEAVLDARLDNLVKDREQEIAFVMDNYALEKRDDE